MQSVYEAAGVTDGVLRLAGAWHARVMADEIVSHAFSHGFHPEHSQRLAAYWSEALGGPTTYSDSYGDETSVVRMHSGNGPHEEMDRRAIACFDQALAEVSLAGDERLRQVLHDYFVWATVTTMSRYHVAADDVPGGLRIPRWSWDGLVSGTGHDDIRSQDLRRAVPPALSRTGLRVCRSGKWIPSGTAAAARDPAAGAPPAIRRAGRPAGLVTSAGSDRGDASEADHSRVPRAPRRGCRRDRSDVLVRPAGSVGHPRDVQDHDRDADPLPLNPPVARASRCGHR